MPSATALVAPIRSEMRPARGSPVTEPTLAANRVSPSCPAVRPSDSFASAIRDAHDAKTSPARAKVTKTAVRALVTRSRGIVESSGGHGGRGGQRGFLGGCRVAVRRVESIRSNRFDIVSAVTPTRQTTAARRPTLRDVARRAGVSTSTASLVFSGKGPVATATAERVRTAANDLAYAGPDPLASSLRQGRVGTVAVVVEGPLRLAFHDPFALAVLDGLAEELDAAGRSMLLVAQPVEDPERALAQLATQAVDAAVFPLCGGRDNPVVDHLLARGVPLVGSGAPVHPGVAHVLTDEAAAMRLTTRHVLDLGHTRVAHLSMALWPGPPPGGSPSEDVAAAAYPDAAGRLAGFRSLAGDSAPVVQAHDLTVEAGEAAGAAAPRRAGARTARRPSSPRPTCSRPAWCAPRSPWACGCRTTSASPASTASTCPGSTTCSRPSSSPARRRGGRWVGSCGWPWRAARSPTNRSRYA